MSVSRHFTLYVYAAVLEVIARLTRECGESTFDRWPFLAGYNNELVAQGLAGRPAAEAPALWRQMVEDWERRADDSTHLPLRALREQLALGHEGLVLLMLAALVDEDPRFGAAFAHLQSDGRARPTAGLLRCWYDAGDAAVAGRTAVRRLLDGGLLRATGASNLDALDLAVEVPPAIADAMRGQPGDEPAARIRHVPIDRLLSLERFIGPVELRVRASRVAALLQAGDVPAVVIRGPQGSGRRTLAGAIAREMGRAALQVDATVRPEDRGWRPLGALAALTGALPIVSFDPAPGEAASLPAGADVSPIVFTLGRHGAVGGELATSAVTIALALPAEPQRRSHWQSAVGDACDALDAIAAVRMTGGNIRRAARLARATAAMDGRVTVTAADVRTATRDVGCHTLETLATRLDPLDDWSRLATLPATRRELAALLARCRWREELGAAAGPLAGSATAGVRALFTGPSGTGKTMAARLLAAELGKEIFRLNLAGLVNKYIGETEKAVDRVLSRGEELDVVLLLDEGDALLTPRTSVATSNDRYANLETNFLLQRLESFEGILFVTTNAADRIDRAFQRRMDVIVDFTAPGPEERLAIWGAHLPPEHAVPCELVRELALRCALTGAQIRNAVVHATLVALDRGSRVLAADVETAVQREYVKSGAACPLRPGAALKYVAAAPQDVAV